MKKFYVVIAVAAILATSSCGWSKKKLGFTQSGPDETLVQTNDPLILPPEFNVRPKKSAGAEDLENSDIKEDDNE